MRPENLLMSCADGVKPCPVGPWPKVMVTLQCITVAVESKVSGIGLFGEMATEWLRKSCVWVLETIFEVGRLNDSVVIYLFFCLLLTLNRWYLMGMIKV